MPIYEYRCNDCGNEYEKVQRITDDGKPPCDACGCADVSRLVSLSSFHLKGTGWYVTDYKNNGHPGSKPASTDPAESKSEAKPEKNENKTKKDED